MAPPPAQSGAKPAASAPVSDYTRAQALQLQSRGARVRWWGGVARVAAMDGGRDCFTLRYGHSDAGGALQWPSDYREMHPFIACGPGRYARELVQEFTVLRVTGTVVGSTHTWGVPAPVLEIEAIERSSACLEGTDPVAHPSCYVGPLLPQ